jgi:L-alanine-DL-glutamate epimerase-like enolase superfamily enzyme
VKITGVRTSLLPSGADIRARCLLELQTDAGIIGTALGTAAIQHLAAKVTEELLIGSDPRATSTLWPQLLQANARAHGALTATIAAVDIACWDAKAQANNEPLWRTLGALRPRVNVHMRAPDDASFERWCRSVVTSSCINSVVVTSSGDPQTDLARLLVARDALSRPGFDCALILDAREQWSTKEAIRCVSEIERSVDLTWIEAPTHRHDFLGHRRILDSIRSGVCAGGHLTSAAEFLPHLHHRALSVVQLDVSLLGITAALQIADAAYGFELPIALTASPGHLHVHLGAALPYCASVEIAPVGAPISTDIRIVEGRAIGGDRAGHGFKLESLNSAANQPTK